MENNYSLKNFEIYSSQHKLPSEYFIKPKNFCRRQQINTNVIQNLIKKQPSVSFIDYSLSNKQRQLNFSKKKQLRFDSAKNLTSAHKCRSLSSFTLPTYQLTMKIPFLQRQLNNNSQYNKFMPICRDNKQFVSHVRNVSQIKLQFNKSSREGLDWGNKRKKKIRRLTGLVDYGKRDCESTFDGKKEQSTSTTPRQSKIQFRNHLKRQVKKQNTFPVKKQNFYNTFQCLNFKQEESKQINKQNLTRQLKISDFEMGKKLGSGNFSQAFLVRHKKSGFLCALKVMQKQKIKQQGYQEQIIRQITIQSYLKHQNIVQLYGFFQDDVKIYLLMQFCTSGHLYGMIRKNRRIQAEKTAQFISGVAKGLQYLHNQLVIHRDLKPQNIFINFEVAKIGDLGWAVYKGRNDQLRKTTSGSPLYYSPQIVQKQEYNQKIDIWGMGATTYECLTGMAPFKVYSLMNLDRIVTDQVRFPSYIELTPEAIDFIQKCLKKKPQQRYAIKQAIHHEFIKTERKFL